MRKTEESDGEREKRQGSFGTRHNLHRRPDVWRRFGVKFLRPGGGSERGKEGEIRGGRGDL
jgi:hypothetical protein